MKLRVKFSKHGALKYIGHLDVMRYFQKANRRAKLDIAYSTGFSPHQIMTFAQPLGIGLESNGEYMDIEANYEPGSITSKEIMDALNAQMAEGIEILGVYLLPENAGNAMASVAAAKYTIRFRQGMNPSFSLDEAIKDFMAQEEITITKKTKRSEATFDMKPYIFNIDSCEDGKSIVMTVDASSSGNLKPGLVVSALYSFKGETFDEFALLITREETYARVGDAEHTELIPLGQIGKEM